MKLLDNMTNLIAQIGLGKSKAAQDRFALRDFCREELMALYRSDWIGRKVIDAPVFDMFREWRNWQADEALVTLMEQAEDHHQVRNKFSLAVRMARLYGGAAIIIGADVANPDQPLRPNAIGKGGLKYLTVVSRWDLAVTQIDRDPASPTFGEPLYYTLSSLSNGVVNIHPSRVLRFIGSDRLELEYNVDGWGDSVLMAMYDAIHHAALSQAGIAELIHEAKVDVIQIPNLGTNLASDEGTKAIAKRFSNANMLKSINNMLLLDANETWDRKQTSFAAMPDILDRYLQIVSGAADIPATRLLGQAPKGLNATGDSDMRNYYDMVVAMREQAIGRQLAYLDQILWIDATGSIPKDAFPEWEPLWQLTPSEKSTIAYQKAQATQIYVNANIMPEEALRAGVQNQLIEDGTYPGLEAAIADLLAKGIDPLEPPVEEDPANDNPKTNSSVSNDRHQLTRLS